MDLTAWFSATVWACFLPFVLIGSACGIVSGPFADAMHHSAAGEPGFELVLGLLTFILNSFVVLLAFMIWPAVTAIMYGIELDKIYPDQTGNLVVLALFGVCLGTWAALRLLPRIDAYFGVDPSKGISSYVRLFCFAGQVYGAAKVTKVAYKTIIHKI